MLSNLKTGNNNPKKQTEWDLHTNVQFTHVVLMRQMLSGVSSSDTSIYIYIYIYICKTLSQHDMITLYRIMNE